MKTTTQSRYHQRITHFEKVQQSLREKIGITRDQFIDIEFEVGCQLIESYFEERGHPTLGKYYRDQLLYQVQNMYWPWYINQKRKWEAEYSNILLFPESMSQEARLEDYKIELISWTAWLETHDKLRHFINQSKTLHL